MIKVNSTIKMNLPKIRELTDALVLVIEDAKSVLMSTVITIKNQTGLPSTITAYIYLSNAVEGETVNTILMTVNKRKAPEGFEIPEKIDLFHHTIEATAEYQRRAKESEEKASAQAADAEAWAHGREDHPDQAQDNAKYYAEQAAKSAAEVPGKTEQAKKDIDKYVRQKESTLKGDTGNVFFAAFKVINGRLKMYSDPAVDKVCFRRVGSRLKYRLKF